MKDCTIKITSNKSKQGWEYQLTVGQAIMVGEYIKKITTKRGAAEERGSLEGFFDAN